MLCFYNQIDASGGGKLTPPIPRAQPYSQFICKNTGLSDHAHICLICVHSLGGPKVTTVTHLKPLLTG